MERYVTKNQKQLRCGITTGTCAAAAAEAAASLLLLGIRKASVRILTPKGFAVIVPVHPVLDGEDKTEFMVIKDSGDDPDVTNHAEIHVRVERIAKAAPAPKSVFEDGRYPGLYLDGGEGIGRVTKEGLEQRVGYAAINQVPRSMIFQAVGEVCRIAESTEKLLITVHVPGGRKMAPKTFNPRLGIEGGISILGTSGILEPMSEKAIVDTIETMIRQKQAQGQQALLVTPGNYGQSYAKQYLSLDVEKSVKCSNYIGETVDLAIAYGMKRFLLVGNIGKLVKLAAGIMNTHSRVADGRCEIFAVHTVLCGGGREMAQEIMDCINTEEILVLLERWGLREAVMQSLCKKIQEHLWRRIGDRMEFGVILFSEKAGFLGQTEGTEAILRAFRI